MSEQAGNTPGTPKGGRKSDRPHLAELEQALKKTLFSGAGAQPGSAQLQAVASASLAVDPSDGLGAPAEEEVEGAGISEAQDDAPAPGDAATEAEQPQHSKPNRKSRFSVKRVEEEVQAPLEAIIAQPADDVTSAVDDVFVAGAPMDGPAVRFVLGSSNASVDDDYKRDVTAASEASAKLKKGRFKVTKILSKAEEAAETALQLETGNEAPRPDGVEFVSSTPHQPGPVSAAVMTSQARVLPLQTLTSSGVKQGSFRPSSVLSEYSTTSTLSPDHHFERALSPPHLHFQPISTETTTPLTTPAAHNVRAAFKPRSFHPGKVASEPVFPARVRHASGLQDYTQQLDAALHSALHLDRCPCHFPQLHPPPHFSCPPRPSAHAQPNFAHVHRKDHAYPVVLHHAHPNYTTSTTSSVTSLSQSSAPSTPRSPFVRNWLGFGLLPSPSDRTGQPVTTAAVEVRVAPVT